jgi:hypothetical protein
MMIASTISESPDTGSNLPFGDRIGSLIEGADALKNRVEDLHSRFSLGDPSMRPLAVQLARLSNDIKNFKDNTLQSLIPVQARNERSVSSAEGIFAGLYNRLTRIESESSPFWTTTKVVIAAFAAVGVFALWQRQKG